jgi:hypothetical protein
MIKKNDQLKAERVQDSPSDDAVQHESFTGGRFWIPAPAEELTARDFVKILNALSDYEALLTATYGDDHFDAYAPDHIQDFYSIYSRLMEYAERKYQVRFSTKEEMEREDSLPHLSF